MNFEHSAICQDYIARVRAFMQEHVFPVEAEIMKDLGKKETIHG